MLHYFLMRAQKFLPEVRRKRWLTNWVRARAHPSTPRVGLKDVTRKLAWLVILSVACLVVIVTYALGLVGNLFEPASPTQRASGPSSGELVSPETCDVEDSISATGAEEVSRAASPQVAGFELIASHSLGGVLIADYRCEASKGSALFRVRWQLSNDRWLVKEISRPPLPESGDF